MVYCGKPSKGCGECRARKIKCDQDRPTCSQCRRANRSCPGYRDQLSLMFRDESQAVVQKARAAASGRRGASPAHSSKPQISCLPAMQPFTLAAQEKGTTFFLSTYGWMGASNLIKRGFDYSSSSKLPLSEKALLSCISSLGMAALSGIQNCRSLRLTATREYTSALKLTNTALRDSTEAKTDATLTAIVLLSLFEIVTCKTAGSLENWTQHVRGAVALMELRGIDQLGSDTGLLMFYALRNSIIIGCLQKSTDVPPALLEWSKKAATMHPSFEGAAVDQLTHLIVKLVNFRANVKNQVLTDSTEILSVAHELDLELTTWAHNLSPSWSYQTVTCRDNCFFRVSECDKLRPYNGRYHVYRDLWMCNIWNNYRYARILANEIILNQLQSQASRSKTLSYSRVFRDHCRSVRDAAREVAEDICYTVPRQLGVENDETQCPSWPQSSIGGFTLLWPLYIATRIDGHLHPLSRWVADCFRVIARTMGIDQAVALATLLPTEFGAAGWINNLDDESDDNQDLYTPGDLAGWK
ncbi:hypothetical protein V8E54_004771 [Elaphomyces granulatus]